MDIFIGDVRKQDPVTLGILPASPEGVKVRDTHQPLSLGGEGGPCRAYTSYRVLQMFLSSDPRARFLGERGCPSKDYLYM